MVNSCFTAQINLGSTHYCNGNTDSSGADTGLSNKGGGGGGGGGVLLSLQKRVRYLI